MIRKNYITVQEACKRLKYPYGVHSLRMCISAGLEWVDFGKAVLQPNGRYKYFIDEDLLSFHVMRFGTFEDRNGAAPGYERTEAI